MILKISVAAADFLKLEAILLALLKKVVALYLSAFNLQKYLRICHASSIFVELPELNTFFVV